jgi:oligopeptide/dipeptide ABC transporter ATP-binding protein
MLEVAGLTVRYGGPSTPPAVDGARFRVRAGETVALVGESGCGKTSAALAVLSLLPRGARVDGGEIRFRGRDLRKLGQDEMRAVLGAEIGVVFQDPLAALDPVRTIGDHVLEALRGDARHPRRVVELLAKVGLPEPERIAAEHPHRLSGGMRQRAMIALAIARNPSLLVADEPTSALDTTVQASILALFRALQAESGMGILLITHDLAVVAENAHRAEVMYAGKIVESAPVDQLFRAPRHPYTAMLLGSHPSLSPPGGRLRPIPGRVPAPGDRPSGCRFRDRCPIARKSCAEVEPELIPLAGAESDRAAACPYGEEAARL